MTLTWSLPDTLPTNVNAGHVPPPPGLPLIWTVRLTYWHGHHEPVTASSRPFVNAEEGARRAMRSALGLVGIFPEPPKPAPGRPPIPADVVAEWVHLYRAGTTLRELEADYPYSFSGIRGSLLRAGVRMRRRGRARRRPA